MSVRTIVWLLLLGLSAFGLVRGAAGAGYPPPWQMPVVVQAPLPATSGEPRIELWRGGRLLATWRSMGAGRTADSRPFDPARPNLTAGPFRRGAFRDMMDDDEYRVYPAVYDAPGNGIYVGPNWNDAAHYDAGVRHGTPAWVPKRITIRGITVNGRRPVIRIAGSERDERGFAAVYVEGYLDPAHGVFVPIEQVTIENIDIDGSRGVPGRTAVFVNGCRHCTLRDMRITHYRDSHGILTGPDNSGTLTIERVAFDDVGGGVGPDHPVYVGASARDPDFTLLARGLWARNGAVGHLLKSRAQVTRVEACYFEGRKAASGETAESYLVDVPDGGRAEIRNNVFVDHDSGNGSNGAALTFGPELGRASAGKRPHSLVIEGNLFVTFSSTWGSPGRATYPLLIGDRVADAPLTYRGNAFVGYEHLPAAESRWRGTNPIVTGFDNLTPAYGLRDAPDAWRQRPGARYVHQAGFEPR